MRQLLLKNPLKIRSKILSEPISRSHKGKIVKWQTLKLTPQHVRQKKDSRSINAQRQKELQKCNFDQIVQAKLEQ